MENPYKIHDILHDIFHNKYFLVDEKSKETYSDLVERPYSDGYFDTVLAVHVCCLRPHGAAVKL